MPVQTTKKTNIYFPDGALVSVSTDGGSTYFDVGAISTAITNTLNYDVNDFQTANAGELDRQIRNMTVAGGFTLINLDTEGVEKLGGGVFTRVVTAGTPFTDAPDQVISSGNWADVTAVSLTPTTLAGASVRATALALTSVTGSVDGALAANDDYTLVTDSNSPSGYSIVLNTAGTTLSTIAQDITVDYASITPVASTKLTAGASTQILTASAMKITHTDDNNKVRQLELYATFGDSGGFQFNFKGANEDGVEEMPLTYTAKLDTSRTSGDQLLAWTIEDGAQ